jgi:hypothetical protein
VFGDVLLRILLYRLDSGEVRRLERGRGEGLAKLQPDVAPEVG